jgi:ATP-binding cassette subfamily C protein CydD
MKPFDARLLTAAPGTRRPLVVLGLAGVGQGVATVATAFALGALVTAVVRGLDLGAPARWVGPLFLVRAGLGWTVERVAARAGVEVSSELRRRLLRLWLTTTVEERPDAAVATTLSAQGSTSVETYVVRFLPALVHGAAVPALAVLVLLVVDWPSAVIVVLTLPLLPLFAALIGRTTQDATLRRWEALSALSGHFLDVVRGLPTLVSYGRGERQVETVRTVSARHRQETMATLRVAFLSSAALELLATVSVALVAVSVGIRLSGAGVGLQTALVAILLAPEAYWPIRRVGAEFHAAADGAAALGSILDALETPGAGTPARCVRTDGGGDHRDFGRTESVGGVTLSGVRYTYPGSATPVLSGVDLVAGRGLTVLTGPSGCGKSTLLEVVAGLRAPDLGTVDVAETHLVTQRPFLLPGSVRTNLALGNDAGAAHLWGALRLVGLEGFVAGLPAGLDTVIGDDGFGLSAGQRARLTLARATLTSAPVVLLDEPTAHLDPASLEAIHTVVRELAATRVVIAVSHRPELVDLADQHLRLDIGAEVAR